MSNRRALEASSRVLIGDKTYTVEEAWLRGLLQLTGYSNGRAWAAVLGTPGAGFVVGPKTYKYLLGLPQAVAYVQPLLLEARAPGAAGLSWDEYVALREWKRTHAEDIRQDTTPLSAQEVARLDFHKWRLAPSTGGEHDALGYRVGG